MKVLVTGGSGFIGSSVVRKFLENGHSVRVLDNLSSGYYENVDGLDIEFIRGDVCDALTVSDACRGVDAVVHMAASVGRQRSLDYTVKDSEINLIGTINVLEGMRKHGVHKIVFSSSAAIYGELLTDVIDENHPLNADSPYGVSKLAAEKMILAYAGIYDITAVCLRYFNVFGVRQRYDAYGNVIPIFAHRIYTGQPITIYGDGEQTRDFINVSDVAAFNYHGAVATDRTGAYNVGSGRSVTINYLAKIMLEYSGITVPVEYAPRRSADVLHCKADITNLETELGIIPETGLEAGLRDYLKWYAEEIASK